MDVIDLNVIYIRFKNYLNYNKIFTYSCMFLKYLLLKYYNINDWIPQTQLNDQYPSVNLVVT